MLITIQERLKQAVTFQRQGQLAEAESIYRQILAEEPQHTDAIHMLGLLAHQVGQYGAAVELIQEAISLDPTFAPYHNNLGNAWKALGNLEQAEICYKKAMETQPKYTDAIYNMGVLSQEKKQFNQAEKYYKKALEINPDNTKIHNNLGNISREKGELSQAIDYYRQALQCRPDHLTALNNLGNALREVGQLIEARQYYQQALKYQPLPDTYNGLGVLEQEEGQLQQALVYFEKALELDPNYLSARSNLARACLNAGKIQAAIHHSREVLKIKPEDEEFLTLLGCLLYENGQYTEGDSYCQQALAINPDQGEIYGKYAVYHMKHTGDMVAMLDNFHLALEKSPDLPWLRSYYLFAISSVPHMTEEERFQASLAWNHHHSSPHPPYYPPRNPKHQLKIGYVSPDFRYHAAAPIIEMLFKNHDAKKVEIFAYAEVQQPDKKTEQLKTLAHHWRDTVGLSHKQMAAYIREDGIDILVDLAGHTQGNRLPVFALKPAPIQVTAFGFNGTTGLSTIDYRFSDPWVTPPETEKYNSETIIHLSSMLHWHPMDPLDIPVAPSPYLETGVITFGSANNLYKLNDRVLATWASILEQVPHSRLMLKSRPLDDPETRQFFLARCKRQGIDLSRLTLQGHMTYEKHFLFFNQVDIALDPFPYNGCITSCETLWMGVPTVALNDGIRVSASLLHILKLQELLASSEAEYIKIACQLAQDKEHLVSIRSTLRDRMQQSPICNGPKFAQEVEMAYQKMWTLWLKGSGDAN